ncbi:hypothetical protein WISP_67551 [Willisornis vidua]|uniref:Secreted protein n=1 Tax=Willisornis vidua TaxID=1566151 RepID=A0ABQ9D8D6_9PASS|nr:hypothetical protein WISP_67551 [Willisornis vidua]
MPIPLLIAAAAATLKGRKSWGLPLSCSRDQNRALGSWDEIEKQDPPAITCVSYRVLTRERRTLLPRQKGNGSSKISQAGLS